MTEKNRKKKKHLLDQVLTTLHLVIKAGEPTQII
jgi:hypothetical protein